MLPGIADCDSDGVLRTPLVVLRNFWLALDNASALDVGVSLPLFRTTSAVGRLAGRSSPDESRISSTSSIGVIAGGFSGLELGRVEEGGGTLLKKDVIGLWIGFDFAGDLAGDFDGDLGVTFPRADERCVSGRRGFDSPPTSSCNLLISVPLFGRLRGGDESRASPSSSDESTMGCLRAARGLPIPPQLKIPYTARDHYSAASVHSKTKAWEQAVGLVGR